MVKNLKIVSITACPTGIAHTYMAAEALSQYAKDNGHTIHVETQGSSGSENVLTSEQIQSADLVLIAADTSVDLSRFEGKPVYETSTSQALKKPAEVFEKAISVLKSGKVFSKQNKTADSSLDITGSSTGIYKYLMTGVSFMIPFVVAGGLLIAIGFALGGIHVYEDVGTIGERLFSIGKAAFGLMIPILAGYIAFSIADRPGLAPGCVGGALASTVGAGFIGAIFAGFIAGYSAKFLRDKMKLPHWLETLKPVLIIPLLASTLTGLLMFYVIGGPTKAVLDFMTSFLKSMDQSSSIILGLIIGAMMAFDLGGPINKAAYVFSTGLITQGVYAPMAAAMAAGMVPPMGVFLAVKIAKNKFTKFEQEGANAAGLLGLSFISEGAIPYAAKDPVRAIPSFVLGGATASTLSMMFNSLLKVPHGGIFTVFIPNAVENLIGYIIALAAGTVVTAAALIVLKKNV